MFQRFLPLRTTRFLELGEDGQVERLEVDETVGCLEHQIRFVLENLRRTGVDIANVDDMPPFFHLEAVKILADPHRERLSAGVHRMNPDPDAIPPRDGRVGRAHTLIAVKLREQDERIAVEVGERVDHRSIHRKQAKNIFASRPSLHQRLKRRVGKRFVDRPIRRPLVGEKVGGGRLKASADGIEPTDRVVFG